MATSILYQCECGERYSFFVTKQQLMGEIMSIEGDWSATDIQEAADGEIELSKGIAGSAGTQWVNTATTPEVICKCGEVIEPIEALKQLTAVNEL